MQEWKEYARKNMRFGVPRRTGNNGDDDEGKYLARMRWGKRCRVLPCDRAKETARISLLNTPE